MKSAIRTAGNCGKFIGAVLPCGLMLVAGAAGPADAAGCALEPQGEGRVAEILDARTFRLADGREVRLAGIEPVTGEKANRTAALSAIIAERDVKLSGEDDTPDRYGRQPAFVFVDGSETPVQGLLLAQGEALVSATVTNKEWCPGPDGRRGCRPAGKTGNLGQSLGHKKRGKSGRYFGRDRAL